MSPRWAVRLGLLLLLVLPAPSQSLEASWTVVQIAGNADNSRLDGDDVAYDRADDIVLYQISTARYHPVTQDGSASVDEILGMEGNWLWFSSLDTRNWSCWLKLYDRTTGTIYNLMEGDHPMTWGGAEGGVAVILIHDDWWLCGVESLQQATRSGSAVPKYEGGRSGNYVIWIGEHPSVGYSWVYKTHIATTFSAHVTRENRDHHSLCVEGDHAAWIQVPEAPDTVQSIYHYRVSAGERRLVGTSADLAWADFLDMEYPSLIWIQKDGSRWKLIQHDVESGMNTTLRVSDLRMLEPVIRGNRILYLTENCPDRSCTELNVYDLTSRTHNRLTTSGSTHGAWASEVEGDRIVWSDHSALTGERVLMAVGGP